MDVDLTFRRHPGRHALVAYAENLVDNRAAIDRSIAAHLSQCPECASEVKAIQSSLVFAASAPALDPRNELTAQILLAGRQARAEQAKRRSPYRTVWKLAQGAACVAAMALVTGLTFAAFLDTREAGGPAPVVEQVIPRFAADSASPEALRRAAVDVAAEGQALTAAIQSKHGDTLSPREVEELRVIQARGDDIAAAVSALERSPQNVRATHVVHANSKSLRDLYVEGGSL